MEKKKSISFEKLTIPQEIPRREIKEEKVLKGESFEDTNDALEEIEYIQKFRDTLSGLPFGSFFHMFEDVSRMSSEEVPFDELFVQASRFSPRVADIYLSILSEIQGSQYEVSFPITQKKMEDLRREGYLQDLVDPKTSWELKINRIQNALVPHLFTMRDRDKKEGKEMEDDIAVWRQEQIDKMPVTVPQLHNESTPGVDPMERAKSNEAPEPIWSIHPAWGGYYRDQAFTKWDSVKNKWLKDVGLKYEDVDSSTLSGENDIVMTAVVRGGQWISLSIPYTHDFHQARAGEKVCHIKKDQYGDMVMMVEGGAHEEIKVEVSLEVIKDKKFTSPHDTPTVVPEIPSEFSEETMGTLEKAINEKKGNIARSNALRNYVVSRTKYLAPKTPEEALHFNTFYRTHPKGFAGAVDEVKTGDCDVVNTYFAALCARINIPVRHVVGHSVKGKDKKGNASINYGTGHAWTEVWDENACIWVRIDATPPGDPNLENQEGDSQESAPGDYGESEAIRPSDELLEELRKKLEAHKERLSYTKEERRLAESTGVGLKEAREIVKEISEAEKTRLPNGELIVDALARLFNAIVEARKMLTFSYTGPARFSEGGEEIEDIVGHYIQAKSGDMDPRSRELLTDELKEEKIIGGFDVYMIGDKSGSMSSTDENGEALWKMQRRAEYLTFSSLYSFKRNIDRAGIQKDNKLSVRSCGVSFRGDGEDKIDLDKPLSSEFSDEDKVKMWHSLTEQGGGNGDVSALGHLYEKIKNEHEENERNGVKDDRLRIIIACSDGGYVGAEGQMRVLSEELRKLNVVVVGLGLTESAASVPVVMHNPPHSYGEVVKDINDLPFFVAKYVVQEALKLFPEKAKENAKVLIESALDKFESIR